MEVMWVLGCLLLLEHCVSGSLNSFEERGVVSFGCLKCFTFHDPACSCHSISSPHQGP